MHRRPGHQVVRLAAVAGGPHALGRGALAPVDPDRALHPDLDARIGGQAARSAGCRGRARPGRRRGARRPATTAPSSTASSAGLQPHVDAQPLERVHQRGGHVGVELGIRWSDASTSVTSHAPLDERLGHLQADVAAAHHDHPAHVARPWRRPRSAGGVVQGLHAVHHRVVDAGQVGSQRTGAGGDVQRVEADAARCGRRRGPRPRPPGRRGRAPGPRGRGARRCRGRRGTSRGCGRRGRRSRPPTRPPGRGCRRPSSWSTGPSPARRSRGRAAGGAPAWRRSCRRRRRR